MSLAEIMCAAYVSLALPNAEVACENVYVVVDAAEEHQVDPEVIASLIFIESRWTPTAKSRSGACGLTQVLPKYSAGYRGRFGKKLTCKQLFDPETSIRRGTAILGYFLKRYRGSYKRSLCSYNAGGSRCRPGATPNKGHRYATKVLKMAKRLRREMKRAEMEMKKQEYVPGCYE